MINKDILQYESKVWATADLLIGAGIKQSDFPKFMMPFFALIMVESRMKRMADEIRPDFDDTQLDEFIEEVKDQKQGYNEFLLRKNKTLKDICKNDKSFDIDFDAYLNGFDIETKYLLGVNKSNEEEKFLDISGISGQLKKKRILYATVKAWSEIDLLPFSNSEITTLEEHIKRKWADISAETAGEQYTPDDIIALVAEIICSKIDDSQSFLTIYDPTCGGGNMLFGVEDRINERFPKRPTKTFGMDWNDALYALAKIESRFRNDSEINYGNTLVDKIDNREYSVAVANPPYGVDWKGFQKDIHNDTTGRFVALPSISDGQFLFTQHLIHHLDKHTGLGVVVHNGSTLFSGDAGSGESSIRKWMLDNDYVEAIIQLPTDEFFNTNIYTYLWILNKGKSAEQTDKVILINASEKFGLLKKTKGKKRKEITESFRNDIVRTLTEFKDNDYAKVFDKWHFYFNKQAIMLTNVDEKGNYLEESIKLKNIEKVEQIDEEGEIITFTEFEIKTIDATRFKNLKQYNEEHLKEKIKLLNYKEADLRVWADGSVYTFDKNKETLTKTTGDTIEEVGCGKIIIKSALKTPKSKDPYIEITIELTPDYQKDYEIIPHKPDAEENELMIDEFLKQYITKPYQKLDNVVGVELNFNKVFYKPETLRKATSIKADLVQLENNLAELEKEIAL